MSVGELALRGLGGRTSCRASDAWSRATAARRTGPLSGVSDRRTVNSALSAWARSYFVALPVAAPPTSVAASANSRPLIVPSILAMSALSLRLEYGSAW